MSLKKFVFIFVITAISIQGNTAFSESINPYDKLTTSLEKKYKKDRLTKASPSKFPNRTIELSIDEMPYGPFTFLGYFNQVNQRDLRKGGSFLKKLCEKEFDGDFTAYHDDKGLSVKEAYFSDNPITLDFDNNEYEFDINILFDITNYNPRWREFTFTSAEDRRQFNHMFDGWDYGIRSCKSASENKYLWHVAFIPSGDWSSAGRGISNSPLFKQRVAIFPIQRKSIEDFEKKRMELSQEIKWEELKVQAENERQNQYRENFKNEKVQDAALWRNSITMGTETSCGMIIQIRDDLYEIDLLPQLSKLWSKDTMWKKKNELFPNDGYWECY